MISHLAAHSWAQCSVGSRRNSCRRRSPGLDDCCYWPGGHWWLQEMGEKLGSLWLKTNFKHGGNVGGGSKFVKEIYSDVWWCFGWFCWWWWRHIRRNCFGFWEAWNKGLFWSIAIGYMRSSCKKKMISLHTLQMKVRFECLICLQSSSRKTPKKTWESEIYTANCVVPGIHPNRNQA